MWSPVCRKKTVHDFSFDMFDTQSESKAFDSVVLVKCIVVDLDPPVSRTRPHKRTWDASPKVVERWGGCTKGVVSTLNGRVSAEKLTVDTRLIHRIALHLRCTMVLTVIDGGIKENCHQSSAKVDTVSKAFSLLSVLVVGLVINVSWSFGSSVTVCRSSTL